MAQMLLFPDPRPLVERLGPEFFRHAPQCPGVYLMRDHAETVLYVGKAKNLRKRLASYRVANPDRLGRRHLRLLRAVQRIELRPCESEASALESESMLLRTLRPRFNRAGTWPGQARFLAWRLASPDLELAVLASTDPAWHTYGPLGAGAVHVRAALARVLWCAAHPDGGVAGLPEGWFAGRHLQISTIPSPNKAQPVFQECEGHLENLFEGRTETFCEWISERTASWTHPFDVAVRDADLEALTQFRMPWSFWFRNHWQKTRRYLDAGICFSVRSLPG
jgi:predicted GIY-YIG superfamily endonuclease